MTTMTMPAIGVLAVALLALPVAAVQTALPTTADLADLGPDAASGALETFSVSSTDEFSARSVNTCSAATMEIAVPADVLLQLVGRSNCCYCGEKSWKDFQYCSCPKGWCEGSSCDCGTDADGDCYCGCTDGTDCDGGGDLASLVQLADQQAAASRDAGDGDGASALEALRAALASLAG